jgi:hypothetical protein
MRDLSAEGGGGGGGGGGRCGVVPGDGEVSVEVGGLRGPGPEHPERVEDDGHAGEADEGVGRLERRLHAAPHHPAAPCHPPPPPPQSKKRNRLFNDERPPLSRAGVGGTCSRLVWFVERERGRGRK